MDMSTGPLLTCCCNASLSRLSVLNLRTAGRGKHLITPARKFLNDVSSKEAHSGLKYTCVVVMTVRIVQKGTVDPSI